MITGPPTSPPQHTEMDELFHSLRNVAFAIKYGLSAIEGAHTSGDTAEFKANSQRVIDQLDLFRQLLTDANRLAERESAQGDHTG
jgi:hypothetical protein